MQYSENVRNSLVLNYESPALTAELQARRAATREHRTFNVQRPIFSVPSGIRGHSQAADIKRKLHARGLGAGWDAVLLAGRLQSVGASTSRNFTKD